MALDPATLAAIGQFGGSVLGNLFGGGDREEAAEAQRKALEAILGARAEAESTPTAGRATGNQIQALESLRNIYQMGGMDPAARAAQAEAMARSAAAERGGREALTQNFAMRGTGGSGAELAAQLGNQQGAAERNALAGTQAAGSASTRALQAMLSSGQLGGNIRGQEDAFQQFNAAQRLRKAGMTADAYGNQAAGSTAEAGRQGNLWGGIGMGAGAGLAGLSSLIGGAEEEGPELLNSWGSYG